jgi:EF hand
MKSLWLDLRARGLHRVWTVGTGLLACLPLVVAGQGMLGSPPTFEVLDSDGNGLIDREEAREEARLYNSFITFDSNGDGAISKREYQRYLGPRTTPPRPFATDG